MAGKSPRNLTAASGGELATTSVVAGQAAAGTQARKFTLAQIATIIAGSFDAAGAAAAAQAASQPSDATLTAFAALTIAADSLTIGTGADAFSQVAFAANTFPARASTGNLVAKAITDFGLSLVDDADASTARTTLGLGTAAVKATGTSGNTIPLLDGANTWSAAQIVNANITGQVITASTYLYSTGATGILLGHDSASLFIGAANDTQLARGAAGIFKFASANSFSANGSVATSITSVGPTGANTTVQEWLTIKNASGVTRYIPCF